MASFLTRTRDIIEEDLEDQVARLNKEVSRLRKQLGKQGSRAYEKASDGASDLYEELYERFVESLPLLRKSARRAQKSAQEHPAMIAAAGLVVLGLAAAVFYRR